MSCSQWLEIDQVFRGEGGGVREKKKAGNQSALGTRLGFQSEH